MPYVSQLIGKPITDPDGDPVGTLKDILAAKRGPIYHPHVIAIQIRTHGEDLFIAIQHVTVLFGPAVVLKDSLDDISPFHPGPDDIYLVNDVLDKQIIDTDGFRVVRVNDLQLTRAEGNIYVANVDVSGAGLLRRLGLTSIARRVARRRATSAAAGVISWDDVELISSDEPMRLKVPGDKMSELHPADLAEILSDLSRQDGSKLLESLDNESLADALEEVEPDFQASLVEQLPDERLADVLEEMEVDEAADLLAELPEERSQELLKLMGAEDAEDIKRLLEYPEDSAGGIMNTNFFAVTPELSAEQVLSLLRASSDEFETVFYIYVLDEANQICGVFSLQKLVISQPDAIVADFMEPRVVTVDLHDSQEDCAQVISKYNLLAVPVVDHDNRMHGIVTADDALDKIIPTAWKKRLPRFYR
jgi:CBS domain-containing protein